MSKVPSATMALAGLLLVVLICSLSPVSALLGNTRGASTPDYAVLAANLVDTSVLVITPGSVTGQAVAGQTGYIFPFPAGHLLASDFYSGAVVLTNGDAVQATSTRNTDDAYSKVLNLVGDTNIPKSYDAASLEFEVTALGTGLLQFQYVFASEEYPEYVGSDFNDAFRLLITDEAANTTVNVAVLPDGVTTVSINNVNANTNSQYYRGAPTYSITNMEYDGATVLLTTKAYPVVKNMKYKLHLVVADVSDPNYDSAVLLKYQSITVICDLVCVPDPSRCQLAGSCKFDANKQPQCEYTIASDGTPCGAMGQQCNAGNCIVPATPPQCNLAAPTLQYLWSPNNKLVDVSVDVPNAVTVNITTVQQNEVTSRNKGDACPDAIVQGGGTVQLRSQRQGNNNGRIYIISFDATGAAGTPSCSGVVSVCVPHDQGRDHPQCQALQTASTPYDSTACGPRHGRP